MQVGLLDGLFPPPLIPGINIGSLDGSFLLTFLLVGWFLPELFVGLFVGSHRRLQPGMSVYSLPSSSWFPPEMPVPSQACHNTPFETSTMVHVTRHPLETIAM